MTSPTREQLDEVFSALVGNGLDFFERSARELDQEQKFSIAHFATGLELLLKARLFHEHWTLIAVEPHKCAWTSVRDGTVRTVQAADLCPAVTTTTGTPLNHERAAFKAVFDHRNRVLHWAPGGDLADTVAEQCLAWYHVRELLTGRWSDVFGSYRLRVEQVERQLRVHRTHLETRFKQIEPRLKEAERAGLLLECPSCEFLAGEAVDSPGRVFWFECKVCGHSATAFRGNSGVLECRDGSDMLDELDPTPPMRPKEMLTYVPDRAYCGECLHYDECVAPDGEDYVCVVCGVRFEAEDSATCEWCGQRWFGWNSEASYLTGCEHCDGRGIGRG